MAAIVPEAPGNWRGVVLAPPDDPLLVVGVALDDVVEADDDPHATRATPITPIADSASRRRTAPGRSVRQEPGSAAAGLDDLTGLYMVRFLLVCW
jgi:hypothetical protein